MDDGNSENDSLEMPTRAQEMALAILPIPSAILSIIGSSIIIYMSVSTRRKRKWTPYTRLMLCLSFYDIVASITLGVATLLRNKDTSPRPLSFGSSGTCSMVGFFNQLSYGTICYNGMLSFYFLMTARFGYNNDYVAKNVEPWMHIISNAFAFITSVVALAIGAYGEMTHANGCWVADYPRGCGEGPECTSRLIGWLYFGLPVIVVSICLIINNSIIFIFVRQQTIPLRIYKQNMEQTSPDESSSSYADEDGSPNLDFDTKKPVTNGFSTEDDERDSQNTAQLRDQARRLRLVSTQAFLYVAFFVICNVWTGLVGVIEGFKSTMEEEMQQVVDYYILYVLQAILAPLVGLFNMLVFIRPKYYVCRLAFPRETRLWIVRRTILGSKVKPTFSSDGRSRFNGLRVSPVDPTDETVEKEATANMAAVTRLPRDMMSSVTASEGDFASEKLTTSSTDGRWTSKQDKDFNSIRARAPIRFQSLRSIRSSVLEMISENEVSTFEHISRISIADELVVDMSSGDFFPANAENRWASDSSDPSAATSSDDGAMSIPRREESIVDEPSTVEELIMPSSFRPLNGPSHQKEHLPLPTDQPIQVPQRRISTPMEELEPPDLSSSFRHVSDEADQEEKEVILPADKPIKVPIRRESFNEVAIECLHAQEENSRELAWGRE
mmetsp:Transcript_18649/g.46158  ORF Transcript_18649/g.46158 Transcript_18649/m.46158 type:complete len:668 (-) Transcript_18649:1205-3208(-)